MIKAWWLGVREFRLSWTTLYIDRDLAEAYERGREFAHWITFRRFEE